MSAASTCSSILWMLALHRPALDHLRADLVAMKRPSEVPPVVDSVGSMAALGLDRCGQRVAQRAGAASGTAGRRASRRARSSSAVALQHRLHAGLQRLGRATRCEKRKLKSTSASPGMTLPAPVPAWRFETCQVVGGKCSLPRVPLGGGQLGQRGRERRGSGCAPAADRRRGPARRSRAGAPDSEPRRPFLIMSPSCSTEVGSPTMQAVEPLAARLQLPRPRAPCRRPTGPPRRW